MKRKIFIISFILLLSVMFFPTSIKAADKQEIYMECKYASEDEKTRGTITIYTGLIHEYYITKYEGAEKNNRELLGNWTNVQKDVGRLGCPNYILFNKGTIFYSVRGYYKKSTLDKYKKENWEEAIILKLSAKTIDNSKDFCFYNSKNDGKTGGTLGNISNYGRQWYIKKKNNTVDIINLDDSAPYEFQGKAEDFYTTGSFKCVDKVYVAQKYVGGGGNIYRHAISTKANLIDDNWDPISDTAKNLKGAQDEWLPDTEGPTAEECKKNPELVGCVKSSCEVIDTSGEVFKILKQILGYVQIGSVFAVLIFCVLDLGGAVASADDDAFRKARGKVMKRIIALILIFLVPLLVNFVINLVNLGACSEEDYDFIGNLFD